MTHLLTLATWDNLAAALAFSGLILRLWDRQKEAAMAYGGSLLAAMLGQRSAHRAARSKETIGSQR